MLDIEKITAIDEEIKKIAPIDGITLLPDGTFAIDFQTGATAQQRSDANTKLQTTDWDAELEAPKRKADRFPMDKRMRILLALVEITNARMRPVPETPKQWAIDTLSEALDLMETAGIPTTP